MRERIAASFTHPYCHAFLFMLGAGRVQGSWQRYRGCFGATLGHEQWLRVILQGFETCEGSDKVTGSLVEVSLM